jgi:hypothetical protein
MMEEVYVAKIYDKDICKYYNVSLVCITYPTIC